MATEAEVSEAKTLGWSPKEQWRGDPNLWVDADVYLERGRSVMPILKQNNERLMGQVQAQQTEIARLAKLVEDGQASMEEFKKFHGEELRRQVEATRRNLRIEIETARKDGDIEGAVDLQEQLDKLDETTRGTRLENSDGGDKGKKESPAASSSNGGEQKIHPDFQGWLTDNSWYGQDPIRTSLMNGVAAKLRQDGSQLMGRAFFDEAAQQVDKLLNPTGGSKVEGGGGGGGNGGSGGNSGLKGFDALPADARSFAKSEARKYVGEGKMFKTEKDWLDYFAKHYEV